MPKWDQTVWNWITGVLGLLGIVTAIIMGLLGPRLQRLTRRLEYKISDSGPLFSMDKDIKQHTVVLYENTPVLNLRIYTLTFLNTVNKAIEMNHWHVPLTIQFPTESKIIAASISEDSDGLNPVLDIGESTLTIDKILMNPNDQFTVTIMSDGLERPKLSTRIIEGERLREYVAPSQVWSDRIVWLLLLVMILVMTWVNWRLSPNIDNLTVRLLSAAAPILLTVFAILSVILLSIIREMRRQDEEKSK